MAQRRVVPPPNPTLPAHIAPAAPVGIWTFAGGRRRLWWPSRRSAAGSSRSYSRSVAAWLPPWPSAVLIAALCVHRLPAVAPAAVSTALIIVGFLAIAAARRETRALLRFAGLLIAAAGWTMLRAEFALNERLLPSQEGVDFVVHGYVSGMPQATERGDRFMFRVERCVGPSARDDAATCPAGRELRIAWYRSFGPAKSPRPADQP